MNSPVNHFLRFELIAAEFMCVVWGLGLIVYYSQMKYQVSVIMISMSLSIWIVLLIKNLFKTIEGWYKS